VARYDEFADWYAAWVDQVPAVVTDPDLGLIPPALDGQRWLDVACGAGRAARELARRGAGVLGLDVSEEMIERARAIEASEGLGIDYRAADVTQPKDWWDGQPFDGAVSEMAFMDIDDLEGTLAAVACVLRTGGSFLASLVHPCFPGNESGLSSWPPDKNYFVEGRWTSPDHNPDGVRLRVGSSHRTLSTYINSMVDVGLHLERIIEPSAPVPTLLLVSCRRVCE